jgi:RNA polymerase sigma factor (sigma-70 family)
MGEDADPEWLALRAEERRELLTLIRRLPEEQQDALALRFAAGMRCPQIAQITGRNEDAVRKLLSRAVTRLRREWAE